MLFMNLDGFGFMLYPNHPTAKYVILVVVKVCKLEQIWKL